MQDQLDLLVQAFTPKPIPGMEERLNTIGGWAMWVTYTVCSIAFIAGAGFIAFDKITDGHHNKGVKIAVAAVIGSMLTASTAGIMAAAR